ncbi:MAG TPA: vanadium-dependent haloperoxidase [Blastocatellia bacterium]|nr:vanadium-dependent haloperoxidase [Blastocatellia bacterium]
MKENHVEGEHARHYEGSSSKPSNSATSPSRRKFLGSVGGATAVGLAAGVVGLPPLLGARSAEVAAAEVGPLNAQQRRNRAYQIRHQAAIFQKNLPLPAHPTNGDEELYPNQIGSYSKALPHYPLGEVDLNAYNALVQAMATGRPADFEAIPLGGVVKLGNPQAALTFDLEGADSHHLAIIAPPAFSSAWEAGEMAEVYWQALTRDVHFSDYDTDALIAQAAADLSGYSDFRGPKIAGAVTPATLFRGSTPGELTGPYISQFLYKDVPYGAMTIVQRYRVPVAGDDFMTAYDEWLNVQNGAAPSGAITFDATPRYIRNGRDLSQYLHRDFSYQAFLNAALILLSFGGAALDDANPYKTSATQGGFATFGGPHVLDLVARAANAALRAAWCQKWSVHRRLRPEEFAGRVHNHLTGAASYPIHSDLLPPNSTVTDEVLARRGTYLLPMAYPEGCPTHPAYPAGHATIAGACTTILKAFFKESFVVPGPVVASADGLSLEPFVGPALTVGGELNKLASNISLGRDTAGVHWRTDGTEGMRLGEAVAISILQDFRATYTENFGGFSLTTFDGATVTI